MMSTRTRHSLFTAAAVVALLLLVCQPALAKSTAGTVTFTSTGDFLQGTIDNLTMPPWFTPTSVAGELRLGGTTPVWAAQTSWNAPSQGNKTYPTPALGDLDRDGDLDLLVGKSDGTTIAYRNSGSLQAPAWSRQATWDAPAQGASMYAVPTLADLDADGDMDLAVGRNDQATRVYRNTGTVESPQWTREPGWEPPALTGTSHAAPAFADLDLDGMADLMIGANNDRNLGYENTGTPDGPVWTRRATWDSPVETSRGWTVLTFGDLNCDRKPELWLGDSRGTVSVYRNDGSSAGPVWTAAPHWNPPQSTSYATPALGNLDDDRDIDLILGDARGTLDGIRNNDAGSTAPGTWTSPVVDSGNDAMAWVELRWTARAAGNGTALVVEARSATVAEDVGTETWHEVTDGVQPAGGLQRYAQVRVTFTTTVATSTPVLEDLMLRSAVPLTMSVSARKRHMLAVSWAPAAGATSYEVWANGVLVETAAADATGAYVTARMIAHAPRADVAVMARGAGGDVVACGTAVYTW